MEVLSHNCNDITIGGEKWIRILPSEKLQPILFFPGITLVQIGAFEYHQINGLRPYNEVGITIPVQYEPKSNYPGKPIIHFPLFFPEKYSRFGVYIHRLPVTTQEAYSLGKDIWGFPKTVDEISFQETDTYRQCTVLSDGKVSEERDSESFQLVRYYGWYSNRSRGDREKAPTAICRKVIETKLSGNFWRFDL